MYDIDQGTGSIHEEKPDSKVSPDIEAILRERKSDMIVADHVAGSTEGRKENHASRKYIIYAGLGVVTGFFSFPPLAMLSFIICMAISTHVRIEDAFLAAPFAIASLLFSLVFGILGGKEYNNIGAALGGIAGSLCMAILLMCIWTI